jgi:hypothetical protein
MIARPLAETLSIAVRRIHPCGDRLLPADPPARCKVSVPTPLTVGDLSHLAADAQQPAPGVAIATSVSDPGRVPQRSRDDRGGAGSLDRRNRSGPARGFRIVASWTPGAAGTANNATQTAKNFDGARWGFQGGH